MGGSRERELLESARLLREQAGKLRTLAGVTNDLDEEIASLLEPLPDLEREAVLFSLAQRFHFSLVPDSTSKLERGHSPRTPDLLLTLQEAGAMFGRRPDSLKKLVQKGQLPCHRPYGRQILLDPDDVQLYLARTRRGRRPKIIP